MENAYQIYGYTIPNLGKERNGDSFLYELLVDEHLLLAAVADGVSKQPCDWLASQTACQKVAELFKSKKEEPNLGKRLSESIIQANEYITQVEGNCRRMASTLSVLVWPVEQRTYWHASIGDSRLYSSFEGQLSLLTRDDATVVKERVLAHGGVRMIEKSILNKVMGQVGIGVTAIQREFREEEVLLLASDGFYDARKAIFSPTMAALSQQENFEETCATIVQKFEMLRGDDLTAIMIKRKSKNRGYEN